jgi:hypothetical protein
LGSKIQGPETDERTPRQLDPLTADAVGAPTGLTPEEQSEMAKMIREEIEAGHDPYDDEGYPHSALDKVLNSVLARHPEVDVVVGDWGVISEYCAVRPIKPLRRFHCG